MIIDELRQNEVEEDLVERSARIRWKGGAERLRLRVPHGLTSSPDDASAYLAVGLALAKWRGESLEVEGSVSHRLLARADVIQSVYGQWNRRLRRVAIRAEAVTDAPSGADAVAAFFSRGVDSCYTAIADRHGAPRLTHLLYVDGVDRKDDAVRAEEIRLAREAAERIGLPLVVATSNVRELSDPVCDWGDMVGAGWAFVALSLGGWLGRAVIPSTDTYATVAPLGTNPLLDPLFSTERIEIEHDWLDCDRTEKVASIVEQRPELLQYLKVCADNRPDNCGRCGKCLVTMASLQAAGGLERASRFPARIDPEAVRAVHVGPEWFASRFDVAEACRALPTEGEAGRTRRALLDMLADVGPWVDPYERTSLETFQVHHGRALLSLVRDGRPYPPLQGDDGPHPGPVAVGLVRAVDPVANRHLYGIGAIPPGELVEELGSLSANPSPGRVPAWLSREGYLMSAAYRPPPARPSLRGAARWTLAPLSWLGSAPLSARVRTVAWRVRRLLAGPAPPASPAEGEPAGYLHSADGRGRRTLYSAVHPVTGDQLLSTSRDLARELGYVEVVLLGHLDPVAPLTGRLGAERAPMLPWASRWGGTAP